MFQMVILTVDLGQTKLLAVPSHQLEIKITNLKHNSVINGHNCHHITKHRQGKNKHLFNWIADCFAGTHGVLCLFYFVLENSCLTQLEF